MIYITGDIHGTISVGQRFNTRNFPEQKELSKNDYVIDRAVEWRPHT